MSISEIVTLLAVIAAIWNAWEARKMAGIALREHRISSRPYLSFGKVGIETATGPYIEVINVGKVPLKYRVVELSIGEKVINRRGVEWTVIFPGMNRYLFLRSVQARQKVKCTIEYHHLSSSTETFQIEWNFEWLGGTVCDLHQDAT